MLATKIGKISVTGIALTLGTFFINWQTSAKAESSYIESIIATTAETMNQNLPMMVDEDTRWDYLEAGPGKEISYSYTMINYSSEMLNDPAEFNFDVFESTLNHSIKAKVCQVPEMQYLFQNGVITNYNYYANDNLLMTQVTVYPDDCGY